jgi:stress response protein YsnF
MTVVLVIEERLELRRVPWVVEEIRLRRRSVTKRTRVAEPVRRERVEISAEGDAEMKQR